MAVNKVPAHPSGMTTKTARTSGAHAARQAARSNDGRYAEMSLAEQSATLDDQGSGDGVVFVPDLSAVRSIEDCDWSDPEEWRAITQKAQRSARLWNSRSGIDDGATDADDIAQTALLGFLERQHAGQRVDNVYAYVHSAARNAAATAMRRGCRHEDIRAFVLYKDKVTGLEQALGRPLTPGEKDQVATDIRDGWHDPRHLPSPRFRENVNASRHLSIDTQDHGGQIGAHHSTSPDVTGPGDVAPGSTLDKALDAVEGHGGTVWDARRMVYNALAEGAGAPLLSGPHLSHRRVTNARRALNANTDMAEVLRDAEDGVDDERTQALFAPWPQTTPQERRSLVSLLGRDTDYAYDLWDSAVRFSSLRQAQAKTPREADAVPARGH